MPPAVCGTGAILLGVFFIALHLIPVIRNARYGWRTLDGEIIGINHENRLLRIRYRIGSDRFHEFDYEYAACFLSGVIPKTGLKVGVTVRAEDPYYVESVLILDKYMPFSGRGYLNNSRFHTVLRTAVFSGFFILCGILFLTGEIT